MTVQPGDAKYWIKEDQSPNQYSVALVMNARSKAHLVTTDVK